MMAMYVKAQMQPLIHSRHSTRLVLVLEAVHIDFSKIILRCIVFREGNGSKVDTPMNVGVKERQLILAVKMRAIIQIQRQNTITPKHVHAPWNVRTKQRM